MSDQSLGHIHLCLDPRVIDRVDLEQVRQMTLGAADYQADFVIRRPWVGVGPVFVEDLGVSVDVDDNAVKPGVYLKLHSGPSPLREFWLMWDGDVRWYEASGVLLADGECQAHLHGSVVTHHDSRLTAGAHIDAEEEIQFEERVEAGSLREAVKILLLKLESKAGAVVEQCDRKFESKKKETVPGTADVATSRLN